MPPSRTRATCAPAHDMLGQLSHREPFGVYHDHPFVTGWNDEWPEINQEFRRYKHRRAHGAGMSADAAGEDDAVRSSYQNSHHHGVQRHPKRNVMKLQCRRRFFRRRQLLYVVGHARQSFQASSLVKFFCQSRSVHELVCGRNLRSISPSSSINIAVLNPAQAERLALALVEVSASRLATGFAIDLPT